MAVSGGSAGRRARRSRNGRREARILNGASWYGRVSHDRCFNTRNEGCQVLENMRKSPSLEEGSLHSPGRILFALEQKLWQSALDSKSAKTINSRKGSIKRTAVSSSHKIPSESFVYTMMMHCAFCMSFNTSSLHVSFET